MIYIKPGTGAHMLLQFLSVSGEYPVSAVGLLGNKRVLRQLVSRFTEVQEITFPESGHIYNLRLISISGKGSRKTMRFCKKALVILNEFHLETLSYYLNAFGGHSFPGNESHVGRNHRVAESAAMAMAAGIQYIPYELPVLQKSRIAITVSKHPSFYFAKNIKKLDTAEMNKTMFTRVAGIIFYPNGCYAVYNTRNSVMKWSGMGEYKALHHLTEIARMNAGIEEVNSAILFGGTPGIALETLQSQRKRRKAEMRFDRIYQHVHFLPLNRDGIRLLRLLVLRDWKERILQAVFSSETRPHDIPFMEYDAQICNSYIYSHIDSDIARLVRLREALFTTEVPFEILCLPWQAGFLRAYLGDRVALKQIPFDAIWEAVTNED